MAITADRPARARQDPPRLSAREDLLTVAFSAWLIGGLFIDGWAHNNHKPESFFTPWHAIFYSGFVATACWMISRYQRHGARVPVGYGLGFVGLALFAVGGIGDMVWHLVFGVEVDVEALLSPTHLVLFVAGLLVVTSPFRAAWSDVDHEVLGLPALLSVTMATATVAFFHMHLSPFLTDAMTDRPYRSLATQRLGGRLADEIRLDGFSGILLTTLILMGPTLLLLRRWRLPAGSLTLLFSAVAVLVSALRGFEMPETVLAAVVAGAVADTIARSMQPSRSPTTVLRVAGFTVPIVLWLAYFGVLAAFYSVGWSVEFWAGITVMSGLLGLGVATLMTLEPPATPTRSSQAAST